MKKLKPAKKPRIGIYTMGLKTYWNQFPGLRQRPARIRPYAGDFPDRGKYQ